MKRRGVLAGVVALWLAGCNRVAETDTMQRLFAASQRWHRKAHRAIGGSRLAPEYPRSAIYVNFRGNGSTNPTNGDYPRHVAENFVNWRLEVRGLVDTPLSLSLDNIRRLPQRTQITRHDCVEGWSAIGEWQGVPLGILLEAAGLRDAARYIVLRCADELNGAMYYESIDLDDAFHPQTIVAHRLNGEDLPVRNGAPLRLRVERQLGYKHAKYLTAIEAVASLDGIGEGKGGYWEDRSGYQWYAGI